MDILTFPSPQDNPMYRDPLAAWMRDSYDPKSPEAQASVERAHLAQLTERATVLEAAFADDNATFDRLFVEFFRDDPRILTVLTARCAARGAVTAYREKR